MVELLSLKQNPRCSASAPRSSDRFRGTYLRNAETLAGYILSQDSGTVGGMRAMTYKHWLAGEGYLVKGLLVNVWIKPLIAELRVSTTGGVRLDLQGDMTMQLTVNCYLLPYAIFFD